MSDAMPAPSWLPELPVIPKRVADILDYAARVAISLAALWAFVEKVGKPYSNWRRRKLALELREILKPELDRITELTECTDELSRVLKRQEALFEDIDAFMIVARTNTERIDETNELLDEVFHIDRRVNTERRAEIDHILHGLAKRQQDRRREAAP